MEYVPGISGSPDAQSLGAGEVFVFTGGNAIHGTWTRNDRLEPFALIDDAGQPDRADPRAHVHRAPTEGHTTIIP